MLSLRRKHAACTVTRKSTCFSLKLQKYIACTKCQTSIENCADRRRIFSCQRPWKEKWGRHREQRFVRRCHDSRNFIQQWWWWRLVRGTAAKIFVSERRRGPVGAAGLCTVRWDGRHVATTTSAWAMARWCSRRRSVREIVRAFTKATFVGWDYAIRHLGKAVELVNEAKKGPRTTITTTTQKDR